jgi:hypothetical protein
VLRQATADARKSIGGLGLSPESASLEIQVRKWNSVAEWIKHQPDGIYQMTAPRGNASWYAMKESVWSSAKPVLKEIGGPGAEAAVVAINKGMSEVKNGLQQTAMAKWGTRLRAVGRIGGRALVIVGAGASLYEIFTAEDKIKETARQLGGWVGAGAGALGGAEALGTLGGSIAGPYGLATGATLGAISGGIMGFFGGQQLGGTAYEWAFQTGAPVGGSNRDAPLPDTLNDIARQRAEQMRRDLERNIRKLETPDEAARRVREEIMRDLENHFPRNR